MTLAIVGALAVVGMFAFVAWPLLVRSPGTHAESAAISPESDAEVEAMISDYRRVHPECPSCGLRPEPGATFCSECGRALTRESASALDRVEPAKGDADRDERRG
jgi:hypothetical protein